MSESTARSRPLPAEAQSALDEYLVQLDAALRGACQGVYLTGSVALGDWHPHRSDLDIIVVTARQLDAAQVDALAAAHAKLPGRPYPDAIYVPCDVLGRRPEPDAHGFPHAVDGVFRRDAYEPDPVLWETLHRHGVTVRGTPAAELGAAPEADWLRAWNLGNLASYWKPWAEQARQLLAERDPALPLPPYGVAWGLLGSGRLHCTIATGQIISKTASADYTARLLPQYAELLARAKAWRLGAQDGAVAFTIADGLRGCELIEALAADAAKL